VWCRAWFRNPRTAASSRFDRGTSSCRGPACKETRPAARCRSPPTPAQVTRRVERRDLHVETVEKRADDSARPQAPSLERPRPPAWIAGRSQVASSLPSSRRHAPPAPSIEGITRPRVCAGRLARWEISLAATSAHSSGTRMPIVPSGVPCEPAPSEAAGLEQTRNALVLQEPFDQVRPQARTPWRGRFSRTWRRVSSNRRSPTYCQGRRLALAGRRVRLRQEGRRDVARHPTRNWPEEAAGCLSDRRERVPAAPASDEGGSARPVGLPGANGPAARPDGAYSYSGLKSKRCVVLM